MEGRIYYHRNKINFMCYVGQTKQPSLEKRSGRNGIQYRECKKFWNAIQEFGWDGFEHHLLPQIYTTQFELDEAEKETILFLNSVKNGYNKEFKGRGLAGVNITNEEERNRKAAIKHPERPYVTRTHKPLSEEARIKISNSLKGRTKSDETRKKLSESLKRRYQVNEENNAFWEG